MTINDQIRHEKLQYDVNRVNINVFSCLLKYQLYYQVNLINMSILPVKIYYHLINNK